MDYFTEYFEDAGSEGETSLMQELGTPKEAAYDILDNLISEKKKDPGTPVWKIILLTFLAICAAPLGGSLLIACLLYTSIICQFAGLYVPNADLGFYSLLPDFSKGLSIPSLAPIFGKLQFKGIFSVDFIVILFAFLFVEMCIRDRF